MIELDTVIENANIATATDSFVADIGIHDGRIAVVGKFEHAAANVIDAAHRLVTPGGVDAHCHLDQPMGDGAVLADDFASGTVSAAHGGTTTVIPFACQIKGESLRAAVDDYHQRAADKPIIDYAFHLIVSDPTTDVLERELPELINEGYTHFKIYMTYDDLKLNDRQILELLALARREGALPMIHAENDDCIAWLTDILEQAGKTAPRYHAAARPPVIEREAAHRAISLAELVDTPVLIVHVSGNAAMSQIRDAQSRGIRIYAETCPQYLFLTRTILRHRVLRARSVFAVRRHARWRISSTSGADCKPVCFRCFHRTTHRSVMTTRTARKTPARMPVFEWCPMAFPVLRHGCRC